MLFVGLCLFIIGYVLGRLVSYFKRIIKEFNYENTTKEKMEHE